MSELASFLVFVDCNKVISALYKAREKKPNKLNNKIN